MGTTGIVRVWNQDPASIIPGNEPASEIMRLYAQSDGYADEPGLGWQLARFIKDTSFCNGIVGEWDDAFKFNGIEDFACRLVCYLKNEQIKGNRELMASLASGMAASDKLSKPNLWAERTPMFGGGERQIGHLYMWSTSKPYESESWEYIYDVFPGNTSKKNPNGVPVIRAHKGGKPVKLPVIKKPKSGGEKETKAA